MRNLFNINWMAGLAALLLAGCVAPESTIKTPMTARPAEQDVLPAHNGAIFQAGRNEHPLFEDRRARNVGDILTINVVEATTATESNSSSASHAGGINASSPKITGGAAAQTLLNPYNATVSSSGSLADKSANAAANALTGTITVTVVEVLQNGNLLVGGEKVVAINQKNEYLRLSGVVSPATITGSNTVQSTQVADVHIESKGSNTMDRAQIMSMLGRAFLSFLPF